MEQKKVKNSVINFITKKGKKVKSEKIFNNLLISIKKKSKKKPINVVNKSIDYLTPKLSVKSIKKKQLLVKPLKSKNQINIAIKWLFPKKKTNSNNLIKHLLKEIPNTILNKSEAFSKKQELYASLKRARVKRK